MIRATIDKPVTLAMIAAGVLVFGVISFTRLSLDLLPDISYPTLTVRSEFPGSSSREVENLVTRPLEERLGVAGGLKRMLSISRAGEAEIILQFAWDENMDLKIMDIREKLDLYQGPESAKTPRIIRYDPREEPVVRLAIHGLDSTLLFKEGERLKRDLEPLPGIAKVDISGAESEELLVEVDINKLRRHGISLEKVSTTIQEQNVNTASGVLETDGGNYVVRIVNELNEPADLDKLQIPLAADREIRLGEIAQSEFVQEEARSLTRLDGRPCVELAVYKEGDRSTVEVARTIRRRIESLRKQIDKRYEIDVVFDQSRFIEAAIEQVVTSAGIGGALAVLVLALFLARMTFALLIAISIPLSILGTFVIMQALDVGANVMSLGGLALGAGMMVDNSIVVLEAIFTERETGSTAYEAARDGVESVSGAVIASTLTTVVVFLPAVYLSGLAGQIFSDLSITVSASLGVSLAISLFVIPCFAARISDGEVKAKPIPHQVGRVAGFFLALLRLPVIFLKTILLAPFLLIGAFISVGSRFVRRGYDSAESAYLGILGFLTKIPWISLLFIPVFVVAALKQSKGITTDFVPELERGQFDVVVVFPTGTSLLSSARGLESLESRLVALDDVERCFLKIGRGEEGTAKGESEDGENVAVLQVTMRNVQVHWSRSRNLEAVDRVREHVISTIQEVLSEVKDIRYRVEKNVPFSLAAPIEVNLFGEDLESLRRAAEIVYGGMSQRVDLMDVKTSLEFAAPEVTITFDRARMNRVGLDQKTVIDVLTRQVQGTVVGRIIRDGRSVGIRVRGRHDQLPLLEDMEHLVIRDEEGMPLYLGTIAAVRKGLGPTAIRRLDQERMVKIEARFRGDSLENVVKSLKSWLLQVPVPPDVRVEVAGRSEEIVEAVHDLTFAFALALFLIYCVMASQFESYLSPFLILVSVPLSLHGVVIALQISGTPFSMVSFVGVIFLAGIAVNNSIVLVDAVHRRTDPDSPVRAAILEAARSRFRPIMMTTITTIMGLIPLVVASGTGSELSAPMAIAVLGGLSMSTLLTMFFVPLLYQVVHRG